MNPRPEISVAVATYNRASSLMETLRSLDEQTMDHDRYEVIVVDDASSDDTPQRVARFAEEHPSLRLRYVRQDVNRLKPAACNRAVQMAHGELVAFVDDDIRPVRGWLEAHAGRHRTENREVAVIGVVLYPEDWERRSNWVRFANDNYRTSVRIYGRNSDVLPPNRFAGGISCVRRDTLIRVGLFDEGSRRLEDITMGCQLVAAGVPLLCEPAALAYHHAEAILSFDATLRSFRRSYELDAPRLREKYPWYFEKYGHWFLEPPNPTYDTPKRRTVKAMVGLVAHRAGQAAVLRWLKLVDDKPWLYWRPLYQYVLACEAADAIRASRKSDVDVNGE